MELTLTFMALLQGFRPVFTNPSYSTFRLLMTDWILSVRHRYVTDLIISSDSVGHGHFSDDHRFFSHAKATPNGRSMIFGNIWRGCCSISLWVPMRSSFWPETTRCAANAVWVCSAPACTTIH